LELILSFFITWAIGMTPPVIIRMIRRRPLGKWPAIAICAAFAFINIMVFIALGSQSKSHAAVFIMGLVSYWILRKEHFFNDKKCIDEVAEVRDADESRERHEGVVESLEAEIECDAETVPSSTEIRKMSTPEPKAAWQSVAQLNYRKGLFRLWVLGSLGWASWFLFDAYELHQELEQIAAQVKIAEQRNADPEEHAKVARENNLRTKHNLNLSKNRYELEKRREDFLLRERLGQLTENELTNPYTRSAMFSRLRRQDKKWTPLQVLEELERQRERIKADRNEQVLRSVGGPVALLVATVMLWLVMSWIAAGFRRPST
jgi:hypothetical protein